MGKSSRKTVSDSQVESSSIKGGDQSQSLRPIDGATAQTIREGVKDLGGTVRLSLGAVQDMLSGTLTVGEATVVNTAVGRVLKAVELEMKHRARNRNGGPLALPNGD